MSGIIFAGCSFTHGHGLWFYDKKLYKKYYESDVLTDIIKERPHHHRHYKDIFRFPRLVCHELEKFEITRWSYSGNDTDSIDFVNYIFDFKKSNSNWTLEHYKIDEISYIIFQTTYPERSEYLINENERVRINFDDLDKIYEDLNRCGFSSFDEYYEALIKQNFNRIKNLFLFYEERGIKCFIINLTDDYNELINSDEYMSNSKINIKHDNMVFSCMVDAKNYDPSLLICGDKEFFGDTPPIDKHPSKKFHRIIANSILEKIKEFEKNNPQDPPLNYI